MKINCIIALQRRASPGGGGEWRTFGIVREHNFGNEDHVARSALLVCPKCHWMWAKILIENEPYAWQRTAFCAWCNQSNLWCPVPGSLLSEEGLGLIDENLLAALPLELVKREFALHERAMRNGHFNRLDQEYEGTKSYCGSERPAPGRSRPGQNVLAGDTSGDRDRMLLHTNRERDPLLVEILERSQ